MTPSFVPEKFERVMGCTSQDLISRLPDSLPNSELTINASQEFCVAKFNDGVLTMRWTKLPEARIALLVIPRLSVSFAYQGLTDDRRYVVQKRFDLGTQRGGG